tara:strand:- start:889 stop:1158 length:270 start_codon:yes stop_codon:yes gene_type:complete
MKITDIFNRNLQGAYRQALDSKDGKEVIADLKKFCRVQESCLSDDPIALARIEGRREVMFHIMHKLKIDYEALYDINHNYDILTEIEQS